MWLSGACWSTFERLHFGCNDVQGWPRGRNSVGRMPASQAGRRRFESGRPLLKYREENHDLLKPSPPMGCGGFFVAAYAGHTFSRVVGLKRAPDVLALKP